MQLVIPIHSVVDLITNSSSEIFVSADESTVKAIKALVNDILKMVEGNTLSADDLFTISLGYEVQSNKTYDSKFVPKDEYEKLESAIEDYENDGGDRDDDDAPEWAPLLREYDYSNTNVLVTPKDPTCKIAKRVAATLSNLTGLFEIDATYG